jgi:hypothetical protein
MMDEISELHSSLEAIMRYIGGISGTGILKCGDEEIARVSYELDGFYMEPAGVTRSGELRISSDALKEVFGRKDVQLLTDDGRIFDLSFSDKELRPDCDATHVDATDESETKRPPRITSRNH